MDRRSALALAASVTLMVGTGIATAGANVGLFGIPAATRVGSLSPLDNRGDEPAPIPATPDTTAARDALVNALDPTPGASNGTSKPTATTAPSPSSRSGNRSGQSGSEPAETPVTAAPSTAPTPTTARPSPASTRPKPSVTIEKPQHEDEHDDD